MKKILKMCVLCLSLVALNCKADLNSLITNNIPSTASLDTGIMFTFAPSLHTDKSKDVGESLVFNYKSNTNDILSYQVRFQHLDIMPQEGTVWQPSGVITASHAWYWKNISFTPLVEAGMAVDSKIHPYGIMGTGLGISYHHFFLMPGIERWSGPDNSFTTYNILVGYTINF